MSSIVLIARVDGKNVEIHMPDLVAVHVGGVLMPTEVFLQVLIAGAHTLQPGGAQAPLRRALYMAAAHCQGGHSEAGQAISELLQIDFPIRMPALSAAAVRDGLDPRELWPWYAK